MLLRSDCYSCKWQFWTAVFFPVWRDEREGVRKRREEEEERGREADKLRASTLEQPHSTGLTMEFKGVCVLLGVLLMVNCSFQQTPPRKKPAKKDTAKDAAIEGLQKQINDIVQELNLLKERQALQTICLKGVKIHDKCFLADTVRKRYHAASEDCNNMGGVLGTPTSSDGNDQLRDYVRQSIGPDEQVWLGINDMVTEGTWADQTGSSITYKNWDTSNSRSPQPDGGQSHDCAVLSVASRGKWFDENCREEKASVCQFNIV
ncbi:tetranectin-like isoform X2 [Sebastes umbrosus]|uniref:tetranectin-like isoform X2 n=1 Tax=Sebastes umbrosus TaxID=72105 RepID=UPI0018A0C3F0|nr:tetranectin-like isoform X2 [Sebastes umbrosus]